MGVFSKSEMERRADAIRAGLVKRKLDACFVHSADNMFYACGVPLLSPWLRPMWAVITANGPSALCGPLMEKENMEANGTAGEILVYDDDRSGDEALKLCADFIGAHVQGKARVGVECDVVSYRLYGRLKARLRGATLADVGDLFGELRIVKSAEELALLELGGWIARIGAEAFLAALEEDATELAVAAQANLAMDKALGALTTDGIAKTFTYAQFGEHSLTPCLDPTSRRLRRGDVVSLNVFPLIWGYRTELGRCFVFGEPTRKQMKALEAVDEAFDAAKAAMRPGVEARAVDEVARAILTRRGYGQWMRHGAGHALGIMIGAASHEKLGALRGYNRAPLRPNMVSSVEPGIYLPELGGFRHSDTMFVTGDGARCITHFPRNLLGGRQSIFQSSGNCDKPAPLLSGQRQNGGAAPPWRKSL